MATMNVNEIDRNRWLQDNFPEWGSWLNEEIAAEKVPQGKFTMWWLACTGIWVKSPQADIAVDFWAQRGRHTKKDRPYEEIKDDQMTRMTGARVLPPYLRCSPHVLDPFAVQKLDALLATHIHGDHFCPYVAAAVVKYTQARFVGPELVCRTWKEWGVPEGRIVMVKPGDTVRVNDTEVVAVDSFDRTVLITPPPYGVDFRREPLPPMDERAVNYIIKTPGGSIYHSGDSHYSNGFYLHGRDHQIDVCLVSFGENGLGIQDKVTASDTLRIAQNLRAKVLIPFHYDMWSMQSVDPAELEVLHHFNRHSMKFKLFIWKVGGKFTYPDDADKGRYNYPKGEENFYVDQPNIPFKAFL